MRKILLAALVFGTVPAVAYGRGLAPHPPAPAPFSPPSGTLAVCNTSGARPVSGPFTYTLAAPAGAGGTLIFNVAVGACSPPVFYTVGTAVIVTENVPTGDAVTSITIAGGSTLGSSSPTSGSATAIIEQGQSLLTFTTSGPVTTSTPRDCKAPLVVGLGLTAAKTAIVKASCTTGRVRRAYSKTVRVGRVVSQSPRRGSVLAHGAPIDLVISRGPRP